MPSIPIVGNDAGPLQPEQSRRLLADPPARGAAARRIPLPSLENSAGNRDEAIPISASNLDRLDAASYLARGLATLRNQFSERLERDIAKTSDEDLIEALLTAFDEDLDRLLQAAPKIALSSLRDAGERLRLTLEAQGRADLLRYRVANRRAELVSILYQQTELAKASPDRAQSILDEFQRLAESIGLPKAKQAEFVKQGQAYIGLAAAVSLMKDAPEAASASLSTGYLKSLLDDEPRKNLFAAAQANLQRDERLAAGTARLGEQLASDIDNLISEPSIEQLAQTAAEPLRFHAVAKSFLSKPLDEQAAALSKNRGAREAKLYRAGELALLERLHARFLERLAEAPFQAASDLGLIETPKPLDFSSPQSLRERALLAESLSAQLQRQVAPLEDGEQSRLAATLLEANAGELVNTLKALRLGFGEALLASLADALLPYQPSLAVAMARAAAAPDLAIAIISGVQLQARKGAALFEVPPLESILEEDLLTFFRSAPLLGTALWEATIAVVSGSRGTARDYQEIRFRRLLQAVAGSSSAFGVSEAPGLYVFRGAPLMAPRHGLRADALDSLLAAMSGEDSLAFGNGHPVSAAGQEIDPRVLKQDARLFNLGFSGVGFLLPSGEIALRGNREDKTSWDGEAYRLDIVSLMRRKGLPVSPQDEKTPPSTIGGLGNKQETQERLNVAQ